MKKQKRKSYKVLLHRTYLVEIISPNEYEAKRNAEYYVGDPKDVSTENERTEYNFKIRRLEMTFNEAGGML